MTIEELQEQLLQEQEQRQKLQADYDSLKAKNEELVANNARLTDYNNKLFMRVTEPVQEQQKQKELTAEELEAVKSVSSVVSSTIGVLCAFLCRSFVSSISASLDV